MCVCILLWLADILMSSGVCCITMQHWSCASVAAVTEFVCFISTIISTPCMNSAACLCCCSVLHMYVHGLSILYILLGRPFWQLPYMSLCFVMYMHGQGSPQYCGCAHMHYLCSHICISNATDLQSFSLCVYSSSCRPISQWWDRELRCLYMWLWR